VLSQYWHWIGHFVQGQPGDSYQYQAPIGPILISALGRSLKLAALAFVIGVLGLSGTTVPEFVSGIILILGFAVGLSVLPVSAQAPTGSSFVIQLKYLILPAIPLVLILFGYIMRMARAGTVEALESDYARTATLKGLPRGVMIRRH